MRVKCDKCKEVSERLFSLTHKKQHSVDNTALHWPLQKNTRFSQTIKEQYQYTVPSTSAEIKKIVHIHIQ